MVVGSGAENYFSIFIKRIWKLNEIENVLNFLVVNHQW